MHTEALEIARQVLDVAVQQTKCVGVEARIARLREVDHHRIGLECASGLGTSAPAACSILSTSHSWFVHNADCTFWPKSVRLAAARRARLSRMTRPSR